MGDTSLLTTFHWIQRVDPTFGIRIPGTYLDWNLGFLILFSYRIIHCFISIYWYLLESFSCHIYVPNSVHYCRKCSGFSSHFCFQGLAPAIVESFFVLVTDTDFSCLCHLDSSIVQTFVVYSPFVSFS